jgi:predicted flavoprotein YhiN
MVSADIGRLPTSFMAHLKYSSRGIDENYLARILDLDELRKYGRRIDFMGEFTVLITYREHLEQYLYWYNSRRLMDDESLESFESWRLVKSSKSYRIVGTEEMLEVLFHQNAKLFSKVSRELMELAFLDDGSVRQFYQVDQRHFKHLVGKMVQLARSNSES